MLTIRYPEIIPCLREFYAGLWPFQMADGSAALVIKCTKECILTAKIKGGIYFYVVPAPVGTYRCAGIISAFFDDDDEPLTLTSPLFDADSFTTDVVALLSRPSFDVHLFDENNHELLGYRALNPAFERFKATAAQFSFAPFSHEHAKALHSHMGVWFGLRTDSDDDEALPIKFSEPLFSDDLLIVDHTETANGFRGSKGQILTSLERPDPGPSQEIDIVTLLQRVFPREQIHLNPMRTDHPDCEFVDVMVVTEHYLYLVQAKDSPNTERVLRRTMERKRSAVLSHLDKAVAQLRGAIRYACSKEPMTVTNGGVTYRIPVSSKTMVGLIVFKEMFDLDAPKYAGPVLEMVENTGVPCVAIDYAQLHAWTLSLSNEAAFLAGCQTVFNAAVENGVFPRLRFGLTEGEAPGGGG